MIARSGMALLMALLPATPTLARPRHDAPPSTARLPFTPIGWALPAPPPRPAANRWLLGAVPAGYEAAGADSLHFDVSGARIKLRGAGVRMKMPIG